MDYLRVPLMHFGEAQGTLHANRRLPRDSAHASGEEEEPFGQPPFNVVQAIASAIGKATTGTQARQNSRVEGRMRHFPGRNTTPRNTYCGLRRELGINRVSGRYDTSTAPSFVAIDRSSDSRPEGSMLRRTQARTAG